MDALEARATEAARTYVTSELGARDKLHRVPQLLATLRSQRSATQAQLCSLARRRLARGHDAIQALDQGTHRVTAIREHFSTIEELSTHGDRLTDELPLVRRLNRMVKHVSETRAKLRDMLGLQDRLDALRADLEEDGAVLRVYKGVTALCAARDEALEAVKEHPRRVKVLNTQYAGLDQLEEALSLRIFNLMDDTFALAKDRPTVLRKLLRIIELDEVADADRGIHAKGLQMEFMHRLIQVVKSQYDAVFADALESVADALVLVEGTIANLAIVKEVDRHFPTKYQLFNVFCGSVRTCLRSHLEVLAQSDQLSVTDIINLFYWAHNTYPSQLEAVGLELTSEFQVIDALQFSLPRYTLLMRQLMDQWATSILAMDRSSQFIELEGMVMTDSIVMLFKFVNQQIDLVANTGYSPFILAVARNCMTVFHNFQSAQVQLLSTQATQLEFRYLLALINNNSKAYTYAEEYRKKVVQLLAPEDAMDFDVTQVCNGFERVRQEATNGVGAHVFVTLETVLPQLFTKDYYDEGAEFTVMRQVVDTIDELLREHIQPWMTQKYARDVARVLLDRLVLRYVDELLSSRGSKVKHTPEATGPAMKDDVRLIRETLEPLIARPVIPDGGTSVVQAYRSLVTTYPEYASLVPEVFVLLMSRRKDVPKSCLSSILTAAEQVPRDTEDNVKPFFDHLIPPQSGKSAKLLAKVAKQGKGSHG